MSLPVLEATIGILRKKERTLFIDYRNFPHPLHQGNYAFPGGKIKIGESREEGVVREIFEETNIRLNKVLYRGKVFFNNENRLFAGKPSKYSFLVYYFDSFEFDDSLAKASEGEFAWLNDEQASKVSMHPGDKIIWQYLLNQKEIDLEVNQDKEGKVVVKDLKSK